MSDRILIQLSHEFINRMREWAMRISGIGGVSSSWPGDEPPLGKHRFRQGRVPRMLGRAHDTEMAISTLDERFQLPVRQYWLFEGRSMNWHGRQRGIAGETFKTRVLKGHELLKAEFSRQSARWHFQHPARSVGVAQNVEPASAEHEASAESGIAGDDIAGTGKAKP